MGLFRASREEMEEQAERDRELVKAESESEQRLQIEVAASMLQAQDQARFKAEWGAWLGNLDRVQKESNEVALTAEILAMIGDVPQPNTGGLTTMAIANYRGFVRNYTKLRLSSITSNATIAGDNQRAFWESVQAYVDENLSFTRR
jgi:hypothetical protein